MRYIKSSWSTLILNLSLILSACTIGQQPEPTPDIGAIFTSAAETVGAKFALDLTQTALAAPTATPLATSTPIPTFSIGGSPAASGSPPIATFGIGTQSSAISTLPTPTLMTILNTQAGPRCMDSAFIKDVTLPDGTIVEDNDKISKRWAIQNTGTCTWDDGFSLQPVTGDAKGTWVIDEKTVKKVEPGDIREIEIDIDTPSKGGEWGGCWRMRGDNGQFFGTFLCLLVRVQ